MIRPFLLLSLFALPLAAAPLENPELQHYFQRRVQEISANCLTGIETREQWESLRPKYRTQLFEMLGLDPVPPKGDLNARITGKVEREDFLVEKLYFESLPGLYVTANLYLPKNIPGPLPTILYVCGHGPVKTNGVSYGNKVAYQHHGAWFARHGYACLTLDTIQLGEIEGLHHGTYREGMWWWNSRGYTPAGVEAWNCIRALDYLETRPEVDKTRFGVTGRSGGGAYSWWITALDDRIQVAAPVAGITDLQNYVVDGVVEGHCDCMFFVNTYGWDYPLVAALAAPRPLLLCNSDKDTIFPLDGVVRTHAKVRKIYDLYRASDKLGLLITEGPHKDTQDLQVPVFRWLNRHLKGEDPLITTAATKFFNPEELKVFPALPADERASRIHESFTTNSLITHPAKLRETLLKKTFSNWPKHVSAEYKSRTEKKIGNRELLTVIFRSDDSTTLKLFYLPADGAQEIHLRVITEDELGESETILDHERSAKPLATVALLTVRGTGSSDAKKAVQIRRRYMLVGQTLDSMRVWDIVRGIEVLRALPNTEKLPLHVYAEGREAANAIVSAALMEIPPNSLELRNLPTREADQPDYLNFSRFTSLKEISEHLESGGSGRTVSVRTGER